MDWSRKVESRSSMKRLALGFMSEATHRKIVGLGQAQLPRSPVGG
jgi:hypothetical protein